MTNIDEAQSIILKHIRTLPEEAVPLLQSLGRVIATEIQAPCDIPPSANSAMDGYAFAFGEMQEKRLKVSGFLPAGMAPRERVAPGHAVRIMTGAHVPPGCDTVVPLEDVSVTGDSIEITGTATPGGNVRQRGEELRTGDLAIAARTLLRPQEIGMLASFGHETVPVIRRPRVAILSTGDELAQPGSRLKPGATYDSNGYTIAAQVLEAGAEPVLLGIAADRRDATREKMLEGIQHDVLVITGGVSVGDRDYVRQTVTDLEGSILFWKVNMKPGKPFAFGVLKGTPVFALPGNPVAAMITFELFARPALLEMAGHPCVYRPKISAEVVGPLNNKGDRPHVVSVHVELGHGKYRVAPIGAQSSARISSMTAGNGLAMVPPGTSLAPGDRATVMLLGREPWQEGTRCR